MTPKKSEPVRSLRSRSITRAGAEGISSPTATSTPARSPPKSKAVDRSPARNTRTRSPARAKADTSPKSAPQTRRPASKSPSRRTPPRQTRTPTTTAVKAAPRPSTPTRLSARQAEKSHLTARISPVSTAKPSSARDYDLPPTPTEKDYKTDKKLQKIVDEYLSVGTDSKAKPKKGKSSGSGLLEVALKWSKWAGCGLVVLVGGLITFAVALIFVAGPLLLSLACDLKSCKLNALPSLPLALNSYFNLEAAGVVTAWLVGAAALSALPLSRLTTFTNYAGLKYSQRANGLAGLILIGALLGAAYALKFKIFLFVSERFLAIVVSLYGFGLLLTVFLYMRGRNAKRQTVSPFSQSGNVIGHIFFGRETNPRLFGVIDIKSMLIVHISTLVTIAMDTIIVMEAFERGRLDVTVALIAGCHAIYLFDFIMFERGLSTTMLMTTEGVGLRLITQYLLFVPVFHTATLRYLLLLPSPAAQWSHPAVAAIAVAFLAGYVLYRGSNYQKDSYRKMPHHPGFSGLELIPSPAGRSLLCGGSWWKFCRHPNHLGLIIMTTAISIPAGLTCPLTYLYPVIVTLGLLVRERRMEAQCEATHGKAWQRYTQTVRSRLIPFIY